MTHAVPAPAPPATGIDQVIARMQSINGVLPVGDGVACFNRMYLEVTEGVSSRIAAGFFADAAFVTRLDVVFANLYFEAIDAMSGARSTWPVAWRPLVEARERTGIESIQFALAGMNAHINHDLALAVVQTCRDLGTDPEADDHHGDYEKVNAILAASQQAIRQSFESRAVQAADRHVAAVANLIGNWSVTAAREAAWDTALALWQVREFTLATKLLSDALARTVAMASRGLLLSV